MATEKTDSPDAASDIDAAQAGERPTPTVLEQFGGVSGLISSTIPVIVFVAVNAAFGVTAAIIAALATAAVVAAVRLFRHDGLAPAISGFLGVPISGHRSRIEATRTPAYSSDVQMPNRK